MPAEGQPYKQTSLTRAVWDLLCLLSPLSIHPRDLGRPVECGCWSRASGAVQLLLEPSWSAEAARGGAAPAPRRETGWWGTEARLSSRVGGRVLLVGLPAPGCLPAFCHHVSPRARPPGPPSSRHWLEEQGPVVAVLKSLGLGRLLCSSC